MTAKEKKQCQLRFHADTYEKIREKAEHDNLNFQQLGDVLFMAYLKDNREIMRLIKRFVESKKGGKRKQQLNELEKDELLRLIENKYSPLGELERNIRKIDNEK